MNPLEARTYDACSVGADSPHQAMAMLLAMGATPSVIVSMVDGVKMWAAMRGVCENCAVGPFLAGVLAGEALALGRSIVEDMERAAAPAWVLFTVAPDGVITATDATEATDATGPHDEDTRGDTP